MQRDQRKSSNKMSDETKKAAAESKKQDQLITQEVKTHLGNHEEIDTSGVEVDVTAGDVDLTGEVDNRHAQSLSRSIAEQEVPGTKTVKADKLKFRRDSSQAP
ncbi:MAG TPA: BON domain-containing protein [Trichormus sp.]|jgi:osmotically-inducible protein OsmY